MGNSRGNCSLVQSGGGPKPSSGPPGPPGPPPPGPSVSGQGGHGVVVVSDGGQVVVVVSHGGQGVVVSHGVQISRSETGEELTGKETPITALTAKISTIPEGIIIKRIFNI